MTVEEKLDMLKLMLGEKTNSEDALLRGYLSASEKELLAWRYSYAGTAPSEVPAEYEMTQIFAVIAGFNLIGAENQVSHSESGVSRVFKYPDMLAYIHANVIPIAGCI